MPNMILAGISFGLAFFLHATASCTDDSQYCGFWAADGECQKNPGYMLIRCAKSCGACGAESTTEDPATTEFVTTSVVATSVATTETASTSVVDSSGAASTATSSILVTGVASTSSTSVSAATSPMEECHAFDEELDDTDLAGELLLTWRTGSMNECCRKCDQTVGCEGFSYGHGTCYLKGSLAGTYHQNGIKTRLRTVFGDCTGFGQELNDVDLAGHLVQKLFAASQSTCCSMCKANVQCEGFSYFEQFCYLKGHIGGTYDKEACVVQIKTEDRRLSSDLVV